MFTRTINHVVHFLLNCFILLLELPSHGFNKFIHQANHFLSATQFPQSIQRSWQPGYKYPEFLLHRIRAN